MPHASAISCGVYGYPILEACAIAVRETRGFLKTHEALKKGLLRLLRAGGPRLLSRSPLPR